MIITIDGPSASGKSTIARLLARHLHFYYLYSGLLYRALAYVLIKKEEYNADDLSHIHKDKIIPIVNSLLYNYDIECGETIVWHNQDITKELTTAQISNAASLLSAHAFVRDAINDKIRIIAQHYDIIADGRDMGSVVFCNANYKFYLTASLPVRVARWVIMQNKQGKKYTQEMAEAQINERDQRDMNRPCAPLIVPSDAIIVDSSTLTIQETLDTIFSYIQ